jgi:hypothetical protein
MTEVTSIHAVLRACTADRSATTASRSADGTGEDLNRTGTAREGEASRIVQRGGRTFHVYGSDEDHVVLERPHGTLPWGPGSPTDEPPAA